MLIVLAIFYPFFLASAAHENVRLWQAIRNLHSTEVPIEKISADLSAALSSGGDANAYTETFQGNYTPLVAVCAYSAQTDYGGKQVKTLVELLLRAGAFVDKPHRSENKTPLMFAAQPDIAQMLIDANANPNAQDSFNQSVLEHAIKQQNSFALVECLLAAGAFVDDRLYAMVCSSKKIRESMFSLERSQSILQPSNPCSISVFSDTIELLKKAGREQRGIPDSASCNCILQ